MEKLHEAVLQAALQDMAEHEAVRWLEHKGFGRMHPSRYATLLAEARAKAPQRLAAIAVRAPEFHADAIAHVRLIRSELWRQYHGIQGPPLYGTPEAEDLTPAQIAQWEMYAVKGRAHLLKEMRETEPFITAYVEAAILRQAEGLVGGPVAGHVEGAATYADIDQSSMPKGGIDQKGQIDQSEQPGDHAAWRPVPDPDAPGTMMLVPAATGEKPRSS